MSRICFLQPVVLRLDDANPSSSVTTTEGQNAPVDLTVARECPPTAASSALGVGEADSSVNNSPPIPPFVNTGDRGEEDEVAEIVRFSL